MLKITIKINEMFNNSTLEFLPEKTETLLLEHSLVSISKWESIYKKPFLTRDEKTREEIVDYIRCMTLNDEVDQDVYEYMPADSIRQIKEYIDDSMTATTIKESNRPPNRDIVTSEIIYYWMVSSNIPFECQYWHLNRLITLISVYSIKNAPQDKHQKPDKRAILKRNASLNAARRNALNTKG